MFQEEREREKEREPRIMYIMILYEKLSSSLGVLLDLRPLKKKIKKKKKKKMK